MTLINKIPFLAFALYYLVLSLWGIAGLILFPERTEHLILIFAGCVAFFRILKFKENLNRRKAFLGCCLLGLITLFILIS
ncbi:MULTISPECIES: hypothetical protein [Paenibacillus]|uniref:hypothetical protein n=1 Tax=Paenibacillus TaxID=44249 RepID=UPI0004641952|nr:MULTISPECIES: hypothetical protein [Paenibacillus]KGP77704.1 hypothetical protein P364_0132040 [Paenibacillus sp. MAEPY2]KGP78677.1 hypothetical protein P363_0131880 [Paenibacillus sp. MAEPY1]OZQ62820.1 hypothetical protein CA599_25500 [Paenibacillus taichungensis]